MAEWKRWCRLLVSTNNLAFLMLVGEWRDGRRREREKGGGGEKKKNLEYPSIHSFRTMTLESLPFPFPFPFPVPPHHLHPHHTLSCSQPPRASWTSPPVKMPPGTTNVIIWESRSVMSRPRWGIFVLLLLLLSFFFWVLSLFVTVANVVFFFYFFSFKCQLYESLLFQFVSVVL